MKRLGSNNPTVYSSERGRICPQCGHPIANCACRKKAAAPAGTPGGAIRVSKELKGRGGKVVTVITGLPVDDETLQQIASDLKRRCGTGGTVKNNTIEIQGDHRDLLVTLLKVKGFQAKRAGG